MSTWWIDEPFLMGSSRPDDAELARLQGQGFTVLVSLLVETAPVRGVTKLPGPMSVSLQETPDPLGEKLQVPVIAYATG